jgi:hypothetical protein
MRAFRVLGKPIADVISPHPFVLCQAAFDPLLTLGARNYWKSHDFADLSDGAIVAMVEGVQSLPSPECEVFIAHIGGQMGRVAPEATAWPNRNAHFVMNVHARWRDKSQDSACVAWARKLFERVAPFASGSVYVNFMPQDESDAVDRIWRELPATGRNQAPLRPGQPVAHEPEHSAGGLSVLAWTGRTQYADLHGPPRPARPYGGGCRKAHSRDLEIQGQYGVKYMAYWFDEKRGTGFCLVHAPDPDTAERVHREARSLPPHGSADLPD